MDRLKAIELLEQIACNGDTEEAHGDADDVLCSLLNELGYEDVVAAWDKVNKWYA